MGRKGVSKGATIFEFTLCARCPIMHAQATPLLVWHRTRTPRGLLKREICQRTSIRCE
jgi:hypothetical protein